MNVNSVNTTQVNNPQLKKGVKQQQQNNSDVSIFADASFAQKKVASENDNLYADASFAQNKVASENDNQYADASFAQTTNPENEIGNRNKKQIPS